MLQEHLKRGILQKEVKAQDEFFEIYFKPLKLSAMKLVPNYQVAEEIVVDVLFKILEKPEIFANAGWHEGYLHRSVKNRCLNSIKSQKRMRDAFKELSREPEPTTETEDNSTEAIEIALLATLHKEIEALPEMCKRVFKLRYLKGKKSTEVAIELGISQSAVSTHCRRAIKKLQLKWLEKGTDPENI